MSGRPIPQRAAPQSHQADADDRALVAGVRSGEEWAFEAIYHRYYEALWAFALGYARVRETAEEIVQDVLSRIWQQRATWVVQTTLKTYLYSAVRNRALHYLRHERVIDRWASAATHEISLAGVTEPPLSTEEQLDRREFSERLSRAIAHLPERRRQAYVLRWQHGLANAEIAALMGISVKGVEMALVQALKAIRAELKELE